MLTRESFLAGAKAGFLEEIVDLPGLGKILVRTMTAELKDHFDLGHAKAGGKHFRSRLMVYSCRCPESGQLLFSEADIPELTSLPAHVIEPLAMPMIRVNKLSDQEREDLEKKSPSQADDSSSD